jgi:hypothetical protein
MKTIKITFLALALSGYAATAQDTKTDKHTLDIKIPEVAILDIESTGKSSAILLEAKAPTEAGKALDFSKSVNADLWLNYSSIIGSKTEKERVVTVQVTDGTLPSGLLVTVEAGKDNGGGEGRVGAPVGLVKLNGEAQQIITGVGSAYTGNGARKGHRLTYKLSAIEGEYEKIDFDQSGTVTVTYTLSDN